MIRPTRISEILVVDDGEPTRYCRAFEQRRFVRGVRQTVNMRSIHAHRNHYYYLQSTCRDCMRRLLQDEIMWFGECLADMGYVISMLGRDALHHSVL